MTERANQRQAGRHLDQQSGPNDSLWAVYADNTPLLGVFPLDPNLGFPVAPQSGAPWAVASPSMGQYRQIVFIDGNVADSWSLAAGVSAGTLAVILNPNEDGVAQIAAFLSHYQISNLAAIDVVAHGADGTLHLGTGMLDSATLTQYQSALTTIGAALKQGGNFQIYGCNVAQDEAGVAFLGNLSAAIGGANVAAASHLVGATSGGGSWDLNVNTGSIDAGSPFTVAAEAAYPDELTVSGTSELFLAFNINNASDVASIVKMAVSGTSIATGVTTLATSTSNPSLNDAQGVVSIVVEDPQSRYYVVNDPFATGHGTTDQILVGTFGSGSLATPSYLDFSSSSSISPWGIAEGPNPNILYIANYDGADTSKNGIWQINVNTGAASPVAVSASVIGPDNLAIDQQNSLGFFTDTFDSKSQIDVGNLSSGNVQVLYTTNTNEWLYGIAVNAGTVYFDAGGDQGVDGVYDATYTLSGGNVTLGAIHTLYSITLNGSVNPTNLAIDSTNGVFYVGSDQNISQGAWSVWEGSLAGSTQAQPNLIEVSAIGNNVNAGPETDGLVLLSTPTIITSGTLAYIQGNSPATLDAGATAINADGEGLASATIAILNGTTSDVLSAITNGTSITASYLAATKTLTLSGADTAAHYQTVLDSVAFSTTSATGSRTIDWTISDGLLNSTTTTSTVNITPRETITAGATVTFAGGAAAVPLDTALSVVDPSSGTLVAASAVVGGFIDGDTLTVGSPGALASTFSNGTLTLTGTDSLSAYQTALDSVVYSTAPANTDPTGGGSHTSRTISWSVNDGTIISAAVTSTLNDVHIPGTVTASGTVTYTGTAVALDPGLTVADSDSGGKLTGATVVMAGYSAGDVLQFTAQTGVTGSFSTGTLTLSGTSTLANYQTALESITFTTTNAVQSVRTLMWTINDGAGTSSMSTSSVHVICFCAGTLIGTPNGQVLVQELKIGDTILTAHNGPRAVKWIGRGKVLSTRGKRTAATPVIVRKNALADNMPTQDLHVTKAHSLYIDDVLIPVEFLVNHRTIVWDDMAREVEVYHVELDSHDVLLANGVPAESFRDDGNRWLFQNARSGWDLPPQEPYAPVLTGGPLVDAVWRRLLDRANPGNLPPTTDDPDLHLIVNGKRVDHEYQRGSLYGFRLPSCPRTLIVASRSGVPAELGIVRDPRSLGIALRRVTVRQGARFMLLNADDERLMNGFHHYEPGDRLRWSDGYGELPAEAFALFDTGAELVLHLGGETRYPDFGNHSGREAA